MVSNKDDNNSSSIPNVGIVIPSLSLSLLFLPFQDLVRAGSILFSVSVWKRMQSPRALVFCFDFPVYLIFVFFVELIAGSLLLSSISAFESRNKKIEWQKSNLFFLTSSSSSSFSWRMNERMIKMRVSCEFFSLTDNSPLD